MTVCFLLFFELFTLKCMCELLIELNLYTQLCKNLALLLEIMAHFPLFTILYSSNNPLPQATKGNNNKCSSARSDKDSK